MNLETITLTDIINTGLLVTAVIGIGLTFYQVRNGTRTNRAQFLKDLYSTLVTDHDMRYAFYYIEYEMFEYNYDFHGSNLEPKVDRLLAFFDLVAELYHQSVITEREMDFFKYYFKRVYNNNEIKEYLNFLSEHFKQNGIQCEPYDRFQSIARQINFDDKS